MKLSIYQLSIMLWCSLTAMNGFRFMIPRKSFRAKSISTNPNLIRFMATSSPDIDELKNRIKETGDKIREMKSNKESKESLQPFIDQLIELKSKYTDLSGEPFDQSTKKKDKKPKEEAAKTDLTSNEDFKITPRGVDYSAWYTDVISAADMVDQSPVRGCMVIKPWGMGVWDLLRAELDDRIRDSGAQNAYFPLFIPKSFLSKEAEHVDGFAKECAVVTHHRLCFSADKKELIADPDAKLEEPLIVRPTSETVIWNMFGKWINSHRDLPLKINQWANVVRWELRTRPFLRSAEFLWQEGHTAHATSSDAIKTAQEMLDMYAQVCEDMLAMPTVKGVKSPSERFAGALDTYTIEALMQNGWALQSGTSHFLGQNFAKAFDVFYQTADKKRELVWATSWGVSTRLLGAMVMTHSDDKGLVLPPQVAPVQVVIVPIVKGKGGAEEEEVLEAVKNIEKELKSLKIRVKIDDRDYVRPGAKYFEWERKGLPVRLELGPKDLAKKTLVMSVRTNPKDKKLVDMSDFGKAALEIKEELSNLQKTLLENAKRRLESKIIPVNSYEEMLKLVAENQDNGSNLNENGEFDSKGGFYLAPWKCNAENEDKIKEQCKATIRCYPLEHNVEPPANGVKCFYSGEQATHMAVFARAF